MSELSIRPLTRADLPCETVTLARYLLGQAIVHDTEDGRLVGRIVETEAYLPGDPCSHCFRSRTLRNNSMFLERGCAYVYYIYGSCFCLNIASEVVDIGAAVLVRALEPIVGLAAMQRRRGSHIPLRDIARGPGRLTQAFGINRQHDGVDLLAGGPLWLGDIARPSQDIGESVRIGLTREADKVLRFYERGSRFLSGPKSLNI